MSTVRRRTSGDPPILSWARTYLRSYFEDTPSVFHIELMRALERPRRRLIARVAPRGHAKSTCAALAYPLWCICEQRRRNIVIITHESALATQFVRDMRTELETNERIVEDYGDLTCADGEASEESGRKRRTRSQWKQAHFVTSTGITVQAKGTGASLRGTRSGPYRPDLIICDDLEKDEHVQSPEMRAKLEHWLRRVVMPALAPRGQIVVLGSLIHYDSLLANLRDRKRFPGWDYAVYRALEATPVPGEDNAFEHVALWPARWPVKRLLEERRRIGTLAFEQEYQANPIDDTLRVFRPEWLRRYDPDTLVAERLVHLMAVDPATGTDAGDYFALWVGAVDSADGRIYTRQLTLERIGIVDQVRRILEEYARWKPTRIGIESTAYQVALKQVLDEHSRTNGQYLPVVGLHTVANKRARIEGTAPFYENGTFRLPPVLPAEVEAQFLHFPKAKHDDAPDVCAMGIELARTLRGATSVVSAVRSVGASRRDVW